MTSHYVNNSIDQMLYYRLKLICCKRFNTLIIFISTTIPTLTQHPHITVRMICTDLIH